MNFYVYEHWRTDRDECFYVGKGKGNRAYNMRKRNAHHKAIAAKVTRDGCAIDVRIVMSGLTENEAFCLEVERIAFWRSVGVDLTNMTSGGEGTSGLLAHNRKQVTCLEDGKVFDSATEAALFYKLSVPTISDVCNNKYRSANELHFVYGKIMCNKNKYYLMIKDIELKSAKKRKRVERNLCYVGIVDNKDVTGRSSNGPSKLSRAVVCLSDGKKYPSASEAARQYNVARSAVVELCLKKNNRKTVGGLKFDYLEAN